MISVCVRVCSEMDRNGIYMEEQMGRTSTNIDQEYDIRIVLKNWVTPSKWPFDRKHDHSINTLFSVGLLHSQTDPSFLIQHVYVLKKGHHHKQIVPQLAGNGVHHLAGNGNPQVGDVDLGTEKNMPSFG